MRLCVCEAPKGAVPRQQFFHAETRRSRVEAWKNCCRGTAPFGAEHTHRRMHYTQKVEWLLPFFLCLPHCLSFQYEVNTYFFILLSRLRWMRPNWCSVHTWIKLVLCKSTLRAFVSPPPLSFFPLRAFSFCRRKRAKRLLRHFGGEELVDGRAKKIKNQEVQGGHFFNKDMDILGDRGGPEDIHQVSQGKEISPFTRQNSCAACGTPQLFSSRHLRFVTVSDIWIWRTLYKSSFYSLVSCHTNHEKNLFSDW